MASSTIKKGYGSNLIDYFKSIYFLIKLFPKIKKLEILETYSLMQTTMLYNFIEKMDL